MPAARVRQPLSDLVLAVLAGVEGEGITVSEVRARLVDQGHRVSRQAVDTSLRRLADRGLVRSRGHGRGRGSARRWSLREQTADDRFRLVYRRVSDLLEFYGPSVVRAAELAVLDYREARRKKY